MHWPHSSQCRPRPCAATLPWKEGNRPRWLRGTPEEEAGEAWTQAGGPLLTGPRGAVIARHTDVSAVKSSRRGRARCGRREGHGLGGPQPCVHAPAPPRTQGHVPVGPAPAQARVSGASQGLRKSHLLSGRHVTAAQATAFSSCSLHLTSGVCGFFPLGSGVGTEDGRALVSASPRFS